MTEAYRIQANQETRRITIVVDEHVLMELSPSQALAHASEILRLVRMLGTEPLPFERVFEVKEPRF